MKIGNPLSILRILDRLNSQNGDFPLLVRLIVCSTRFEKWLPDAEVE